MERSRPLCVLRCCSLSPTPLCLSCFLVTFSHSCDILPHHGPEPKKSCEIMSLLPKVAFLGCLETCSLMMKTLLIVLPSCSAPLSLAIKVFCTLKPSRRIALFSKMSLTNPDSFLRTHTSQMLILES